jgi:hypothetical protein
MTRHEIGGTVTRVNKDRFWVDLVNGGRVEVPFDRDRGDDLPTVGARAILAIEVYSAGT